MLYDPNAAPAALTALPVAPESGEGQVAPAQPRLPEHNAIVVSYAGQVVPILSLDTFGANSAGSMEQGRVFAVSAAGHIATVRADRMLYVNGQVMNVSPASIYGLPDNLSIGNLAWSSDGTQLAFRVDAADPNAHDAIDSGVWVYNLITDQSRHIFRNTYEGQAAQLHEQRRAIDIQWSPNDTTLLIAVTTRLGRANVFVPANHNANDFINAIPYANATWAANNASVIVSGKTWDGTTVLGQVALDAAWTYNEYQNQNWNGLVMQAAAQLPNNQLAFLGQPTPTTFALYVVPAGAGHSPNRISNLLNGQVIEAEWNAQRSAVLVTVQAGSAQQLWLISKDGTAQNITPSTGIPDAAHWR